MCIFSSLLPSETLYCIMPSSESFLYTFFMFKGAVLTRIQTYIYIQGKLFSCTIKYTSSTFKLISVSWSSISFFCLFCTLCLCPSSLTGKHTDIFNSCRISSPAPRNLFAIQFLHHWFISLFCLVIYKCPATIYYCVF